MYIVYFVCHPVRWCENPSIGKKGIVCNFVPWGICPLGGPSCPCGAVWWQTISVKIFHNECMWFLRSQEHHVSVYVCVITLVLISMVTVIQDGLWKWASCRHRCVLSLLPCVCPIQLWEWERGTERVGRQCRAYGRKDERMGTKKQQKWSTREWRKTARWRVVIRSL